MNTEVNKQPSFQQKKESMGPSVKAALVKSKNNNKIRKIIINCIKDNFKIIPEIASETSIPTDRILWHLMTLRKYGTLLEGEERDDFIEYSIKSK